MPGQRITSPLTRITNDLVTHFFKRGASGPEPLPAHALVYLRRLEPGATVYRITIGEEGAAAAIHRGQGAAWEEVRADRSGVRALHLHANYHYAAGWRPPPAQPGSGSGGGGGSGGGSGGGGSGGAGSGAGSGAGASGEGTGAASGSGDGSGEATGASGGTGAGSADATAGGATADGTHAGPGGSALANPRWGAETLAHGPAEMHVDAPGLDGRAVRFVVERSRDGQSWERFAEATARVSGGHAVGSADLVHPAEEHRTDCHFAEGAPLEPLSLRFRAMLDDGGSDGSGSGTGVDGSGAGGAGSGDATGSGAGSGSGGASSDGSGDSTGSGSSDGSGDGTGSGSSDGSGDGTGSGDGSGAGSGGGTGAHAEDAPAAMERLLNHAYALALRPAELRQQRLLVPMRLLTPPAGLSGARFAQIDHRHAGQAELHVDAHGLDGRTVHFTVEHSFDGVAWARLATATGQVSNGTASARVRLDHPAVTHQASDPTAHAPRLVRFHATLEAPQAAPDGALGNPRWGERDYPHGAEAEMLVDAPGLDCRTVRFTIEHSADGQRWESLAETTAVVQGGLASGRARLAHPAAASGATSSTARTPRSIRFHASLV